MIFNFTVLRVHSFLCYYIIPFNCVVDARIQKYFISKPTSTFGCKGVVHWAECLNGLSTEWLTAAQPEEKVKKVKAYLKYITL